MKWQFPPRLIFGLFLFLLILPLSAQESGGEAESEEPPKEEIRSLREERLRTLQYGIDAALISLVGDLAHAMLKTVCAGRAVIGVDGVSVKFGFTTPIQEEAAVTRRMIEQTAGPIIMVADSSKMGVVSNFVTVPIQKADILITDAGIKPGFKKELEEKGIQVVVV